MKIILGSVKAIVKDKVAVVTGSGQGLGKAIAIVLAKEGAKVGVNNRSPDSKGGTAEETAKIIKEVSGEAIEMRVSPKPSRINPIRRIAMVTISQLSKCAVLSFVH